MAAASDLILSIREQIPDATTGDDPALDGKAFSLATLLRWINDAGRLMCAKTPIIRDWYGLPTVVGKDVYVLPDYITSVEQVFYDLYPMGRAPEENFIFASKVEGRSWWFGPHAIHAIPRLFVWPAPSSAGASTTLNGSITATATSLTLTSGTGVQAFGFLRLGGDIATSELIRYSNIVTSTGVVSNMLRGQGGTVAQAWANLAVVDEGNLFFNCYRLPVPLKTSTDPVEMPQALWPLIELYVLSKVRSAEQDDATALQLRQEFFQILKDMLDAAPLKGLRQGLQVRTTYGLPELWRGRLIIP